MNFLDRLGSFFGYRRNDNTRSADVAEMRGVDEVSSTWRVRSFPQALEPILTDRPNGDGGIQGLDWYKNSLRMDKDGDVANDFIEVRLPSEEGSYNRSCPSPTFIRAGESIQVKGEELRDGVVYYSVMPKGQLH